MSRLYGEPHRQLQDEFETRQLADTVEKVIAKNEKADKAGGTLSVEELTALAKRSG